MSSPPSVPRTEAPAMSVDTPKPPMSESELIAAGFDLAARTPPSHGQLTRWLEGRDAEISALNKRIAALEEDNDLLRASLENSRDGWRKALRVTHETMFRKSPSPAGEMYCVVWVVRPAGSVHARRVWAPFVSLAAANGLRDTLAKRADVLDVYVSLVSR